MKLSQLLVAAALMLGAGCNSLDNPLADFPLFKSGHDGRAFNPQTGEYEWPDRTAAHGAATPSPTGVTSRAARQAAEPAAPSSDARPYNVEKGEFTDPPPGH